MKITNIECIPVQAPGRTLVTVLVETDEGITGVGEAGLLRPTSCHRGRRTGLVETPRPT
jgi:L-alanine-DL-glutamate epimerase-like enolase superfamily enzyme